MSKENRKNLIGFRLTDKEVIQLDDMCKKSNLNRSDVIRILLNGGTIYRVDGFCDFTVQLLRIGNNLNQVARVLNYNPYSNVAEYLPQIQKDFKHLRDDVDEVARVICR